jgi:hypothetical protein
MNPFSSSLSGWNILLQSVKGASRSLFLFSCISILTSSLSTAQQNGVDQDSEIITTPAGDHFLRWYGHAGRSYFIQVSDHDDPLGKWNWAPLIEGGADGYIEHLIGGTASKAFVRLKYTSLTPGPNETLDTADFDQDGLSNLSEISPPPPLLSKDATDPLNPDSDNDGLTDGYERDNGLDPNDPGTGDPDKGPNGDPDNDGLTNTEEQALGTNPKNAHSDSDSLNDGEDAVPLDGEINWRKSSESKYVWIEQINASPDYGSPLAVNKHGQILFTQDFLHPITSGTLENILWSSKLQDWVDIAAAGSQNLNAEWFGSTLATIEAPVIKFYDINDNGVIYGQSLGVEDGNLGIRPGMIWKRTSSTLEEYSSPEYFFPQFPLPAPIDNDYGIEVTTGSIAHDGTTSAFVYQNKRESVSWMTYDSCASSPTFSMDSVKAFNNGNAGSHFGKTFAGAILDKDRALFVETTTSSTGIDDYNLWLKEEDTQIDLSFMTPHPVSLAEMSLAPSKKTDNSDRLWITTGPSVYLEKREGGTGVGRWHQPPSMQIGASLLHSSGIALKGSEILTSGETTLPWLWRNGKYTGLNNPSLTSKPASVEITEVIDIASNGIILAEAKEEQVKKTGLLYPVQIRGYATEQGEDDIGVVNGIYLKEKKRKLVEDSPGDPDDTSDTDFKTEAKTKLKIAQLGGDSLFTSNAAGDCTFVHEKFKEDLDIFRVRLPDLPIPAPSTEHRVKIWTTTINGSTVFDPGAEVDLNIFREDPSDPNSPVKFHESAALALVADTEVEGTEVTDDKFAVEGIADGALGDRTYRAVLGGMVKFKWLTAPGQPEFEIPVIDGRDVHVTGFIMPGGANQAKATRWFERAKEIYSAIGVNLIYDFKTLASVPAGVNLTDGFTIPGETTEHLIEMQPETRALMNVLTQPDYQVAPDAIPIFFVSEFAGQGVSNVPSLMALGDESYGGAIFIDSTSDTTQLSALAHELAHVLLDAGHHPSPKALWNYDFTGKKCYVWWGHINENPLDPTTWEDTGIIAHRRFRDSMRTRILKSKYVKP